MTLEEALVKIKEQEAEKATLLTTIQEKDAKITEQEAHIAKQGENFKRLRDMTQEERESYTEKELDLMKRQEALLADQEQIKKEQADFLAKQKENTVNALVNKYARNDPELAKKIRFNAESIKDFDTASDETAIAPIIEKAVFMLGDARPDPLRTAHNTGGQPAPEGTSNFADTEAGKAIAQNLNLEIAKPEPAK